MECGNDDPAQGMSLCSDCVEVGGVVTVLLTDEQAAALLDMLSMYVEAHTDGEEYFGNDYVDDVATVVGRAVSWSGVR